MSDTPILYFVVPGDIDTRTGGYGYDRAIIAGLRDLDWDVNLVSVAGNYPFPTEDERQSAARALAAVPDDALVVVDGLAFGAIPEQAFAERERLRLVALVHHPLGLETGLSQAVSEQLLDSERRALRSARGVVVTSKRTVRAVVDLGVSRDHIVVVEPGTDISNEAPGSSGDTLEMLCVASMVPRKGHDTLFDALEPLTDLKWHLTCAGRFDRSDAYANQLFERSESAPLAGRVTIAGELRGDALEHAYAHTDLFVLPTHYEGYGMVVAEALAHAIPVVSTPTGGIVDLVGNDAGVLIQAGDAAALTDTLRRVLTDRALLTTLRSGARRARIAIPTWVQACSTMADALARFANA